MRVIKDADVRKNEILDAADVLFNQKGFDGTSISDIIEKVNVARGTIYYHFKSKEDILDALIDRYGTQLILAVKEAGNDRRNSVMERLKKALMAMNVERLTGSELLEQMHKPQNALMHQKSRRALLLGITPVLTEIVQEGIPEGIFKTPFPYEGIELLMAYTSTVFDDGFLELVQEAQTARIKAFIYYAEKVLGTQSGALSWMVQLFGSDLEGCDK